MTLVVGLTGGIGVGKSSAAAMFAERGATVIDVDALGRAVLEPDGGAFAAVVATFGPGVLDDDGQIDRAALARVVFDGSGRLDELEAISHPAINGCIVEAVDRAHDDEVVILDMAVLVESQLGRVDGRALYDRVLVVEAPLGVRVPRLVARGMSEADARNRIKSQATDEDRRAVADVVLANDGHLVDLERRVEDMGPTIAAWRIQRRGTAASTLDQVRSVD